MNGEAFIYGAIVAAIIVIFLKAMMGGK